MVAADSGFIGADYGCCRLFIVFCIGSGGVRAADGNFRLFGSASVSRGINAYPGGEQWFVVEDSGV